MGVATTGCLVTFVNDIHRCYSMLQTATKKGESMYIQSPIEEGGRGLRWGTQGWNKEENRDQGGTEGGRSQGGAYHGRS